ncbi:hypothetical protein DRJ22_06085, partial [Candidatus Woesearchaeota archaeon]
PNLCLVSYLCQNLIPIPCTSYGGWEYKIHEIFRQPPFFATVIIGEIDIEADATSASGIEKVEFYVDDEIKEVDNSYPYNYTWDEKILFRHRHVIKVIAYDYAGNKAEDEMRVWKFK